MKEIENTTPESIITLRKYIKSKNDLEKLKEKLVDMMYKQEPISDNFMYDGFIIGLICYTPFILDLILSDDNIGRVLEGTSQKLELIFGWIDANIGKVINIIKK